jgi:hypothetical protein
MQKPLIFVQAAVLLALLFAFVRQDWQLGVGAIILFLIPLAPILGLNCHRCGFNAFLRYGREATLMNPLGMKLPPKISQNCSKCGAPFFVPDTEIPKEIGR